MADWGLTFVPYVKLFLTVDGPSNGVFTVSSTNQLRIGAIVYLSADTLITKTLQITDIISQTQFSAKDADKVGYVNFNSAAYTMVLNAAITQPQQNSFYMEGQPDVPDIYRVLRDMRDGVGIKQGAPNTLANGWPVKVTDGTNVLGTPSNPIYCSGLSGVSGGTASLFAATFPGTGTAVGFTDGTNMQGAKVWDTDTGGGTEYTLGVVLRKPASGGSVVFGTSTDPFIISGTKTNNGGAVSTDNLGVLPAVATAAAPTYNEGRLVGLSTDLAGALRVSGSFSATNPSIGTIGSALPASATAIGGTDGTNLRIPVVLNSTPAGSEYAMLVRLVGAAAGGTSSSFAAAFPSLGTALGVKDSAGVNMTFLKANASNALLIDGSAVTQPISAVSLPLPTGAATETTLGTRLADSTFTTRINTLGQKTMANSTPVTLASDQSALTLTYLSVIDSNNSSTATLGANGVFTGVASSTLSSAQVMVHIFSNVASATPIGLQIQFSPDGTNWNESFVTTYTPGIAPNDGQTFTVGIRGAFVRVVYTNGGTIQAAFRVQTILKKFPDGADVMDLSTGITSTNHAMVTRAILSGLNGAGGGNYVDVKVDPDGALIIDGDETPSDAFANPTTAVGTMAHLMGWNGTTWDRILCEATNGDAEPGLGTGALVSEVYPMNFNGTTWDRMRGNTNHLFVGGPAGTGTGVTGNPVLVGGSDGVNVRNLRTATDGTLRIDPTGTTTQPISAVSLPLPTGAAQDRTTSAAPFAVRLSDGTSFFNPVASTQIPAALVGGRLDTNIGSWFGSIAPTVGQKVMGSSLPVTIASDQSTLNTKGTTESATAAAVPANATMVGGSDGTNLRAIKVDAQGRVNTAQSSSTSNVTRSATSTASTTILAANTSRLGVIIVNDSVNILYVKFGAVASTTSFTYRVASNGTVEIPFGYTGQVDAILNTGTGNAQVTELTN